MGTALGLSGERFGLQVSYPVCVVGHPSRGHPHTADVSLHDVLQAFGHRVRRDDN